MMYAGFIIAFILCFFTSLLNEENAGSLLSGYNTMSDERKKKVNFKEIVKIHKIVFYSISAYLAVVSLINLFLSNFKFFAIAMTLGLSWGFIPLFFMGSSYDKNVYKKWEIGFQRFMIAFLFFGGLLLSYFIWTTPLNELNLYLMINTLLQFCNQMLLCVGIVFILAGVILYAFPPKKINGLYGYRTQTSMQSQQKWDFAQTYSAKIMMLTGLIFTLISPSKGLFKTNESIDLAIGMFCMIVGSILMIVVVEKALRKVD